MRRLQVIKDLSVKLLLQQAAGYRRHPGVKRFAENLSGEILPPASEMTGSPVFSARHKTQLPKGESKT